jgi:hypothetical protein
MSDVSSRVTTALADRYRVDRAFGEGGGRTTAPPPCAPGAR